MAKNDPVDTYKNIDFKTFLNTNLKASDLSLLKTDLNKHEKLLKGINQNIYKTFLLNTDILVNMLEKTNDISKKIKETETLINDCNIIFGNLDEDENIPYYIDETKQKNFYNKIEKFDDSAQILKTSKRYLIYDAMYRIRENDKVCDNLLLFTNDILIIGEKIQNKSQSINQKDSQDHNQSGNKYVLKNAFNYNVMKLNAKGEKLTINVTPFEFVFEGEEQNVREASKVFKELMFKNKLDIKKENNYEPVKSDYINFLIETENYKSLRQMKDINLKNVNINIKTIRGGTENLILILKLISDDEKRENLFFEYLTSIFDRKLFIIDISQSLTDIIDGFFANFSKCYDKSDDIMEMYFNTFKETAVIKARFVILLTTKIEQIFELLTRRIYGKYSNLDNADAYIAQIQKYLVFDNYDFTFVTDFFETEKNQRKGKVLTKAKTQIKGIIDEMIQQDFL